MLIVLFDLSEAGLVIGFQEAGRRLVTMLARLIPHETAPISAALCNHTPELVLIHFENFFPLWDSCACEYTETDRSENEETGNPTHKMRMGLFEK